MLANFSQFSPQGLIPPQGAGWPQMSPGLFGQLGANSGNSAFGQESAQGGLGLQSPFGWQNPFTSSPYLNSPLSQGYLANSPLQGQGANAGPSAMHNPQYIIAVLGQIAQQFYAHSATAQQIGIGLHQLVQQLLVQSSSGGGAGQYFGQGHFGGTQGSYSGFNPQAAQFWGANRPQTIQ